MLGGLFSFLGSIGSVFKTISPLANFIGNIVGGSKAREQASDDAERNRQFQREERLATQQWQEDMMYKQNTLGRENQEWSFKNFDSPNAQRQAMESAGVNPFVQGSALQPGFSSAMPAASPPSGNPSSGSMPSGKKYEAQMMMAGAVGQAALLQSEIELKKAQAANVAADTKQKQGNTLDPQLTQELQRLGLSIKSSEDVIARAKAEFARAREEAELGNIKATFDRIEAETKKLLSEQGLNEARIEEAWASINLKMSQAYNLDEQTTDLRETRDSRIKANEAEADLKRALTMTENDLRNLKRSEFEENIQLIRGYITKNATEVEIKEIEKKLDKLDYDYLKTAQGMRLYQDVAKTLWDMIPINALGGIMGARFAGKGRR